MKRIPLLIAAAKDRLVSWQRDTLINGKGWPRRVPILKAADLKRKSLWWHLSKTFRSHDNNGKFLPFEGIAATALVIAIQETCPFEQFITFFYDEHRKSTSARVWNRAMFLLGYTEGNPESLVLPAGLK